MNVNDNSDQAGAGSQRPEEQDEQRDGGSAGRRSELESEKLPDPPGAEAADSSAIGEILEGEVEPPPEDPRVSEVAALQQEVAKLKDHLLRTMAEQENTQKRHAKDREDAVKYAASKFAKDMLDVADNLRRAIDAAAQGPKREELPEPMRNLLEGVEATERSLLQAFERNGIQRIEAMGEKFNPNLHEAMFEVEDPNQPAGTVVQVMAPGYTIADRLLRPAQVGVSRGGQAQPRVDTKA